MTGCFILMGSLTRDDWIVAIHRSKFKESKILCILGFGGSFDLSDQEIYDFLNQWKTIIRL